ncbi:MAG: DUF2784 domain-containing protein [Gemmataceae bacterium]
MSPTWYRFWADFVVVLHAGYILFVLAGLALILLGWPLKWHWIRSIWFRSLHLAAIAVVVAESLLDIECPLTTWEKALRDRAGEASYPGDFIGHWANQLIFYDVPASYFTPIYCLVGAAVLATFIFVPPRLKRKERVVVNPESIVSPPTQ